MRRKLALALAAAAAAGLGVAGLSTAGVVLAPLSGGTMKITISALVPGGGRTTGGNMVNYSAIGGHGQAMSGGTLTVTPGALAFARTARLNTDEAHAYPTPFIPSRGHQYITFTRLPAEAIIHVYTLSGRLVKTLRKNDSTDLIEWRPVVNEDGAPVVSGVYPFVVIHPGFSKKRGKIMVIK